MHTFFVALGLRYPLVQAPMAGVQDARLAIAASRAGALGSLPCAMLDAKELQQQVQALRTALGPTGVFNLNFFCHRPQPMTAPQAAAWREVLSPLYAEYGLGELPAQLPAHLAAALRQPFTQDIAKAIAPFRPPVLSFHFGLPEPALLEYARSWGAGIRGGRAPWTFSGHGHYTPDGPVCLAATGGGRRAPTRNCRRRHCRTP